MKTIMAFSPAHITSMFRPNNSEDPLKKGSIGSGVSIKCGVLTKVRVSKASKWKTKIRINKIFLDAKVSSAVVNEYSKLTGRPYDVSIEHMVEVPIGAGYGVSGAGALSLSIVLNEALNAGLSRIEAAQLAHIAEIRCKTGLGTVLAETFGGVEIREKAGSPGYGSVRKIDDSNLKVVSLYLNPLFTEYFLSNPEFYKRVNIVGKGLMNQLIKSPSIKNFILLSRFFADGLNLYSCKLREILRELDASKFLFTMNMFGEALFTLVKEDELQNLIPILCGYESQGVKIIVSHVDKKGARLME